MKKLEDGIILYHGSYCVVEKPDLEKCALYKDFGRGFYLTTSKEQAKSFAKISATKARAKGLLSYSDNFAHISNATILAYMGNLYGTMGSEQADKMCISLLLPERLQDQFCFRSGKAIASLEYLKSEKITLEQ